MRRVAHLPDENANHATGDVRIAELVASMSLATDLGNGQPLETALRCTLLGLRLAEAAGVSAADREAVFWGGLLRFVGCVGTSVEESAFGGDDLALRAGLLAVDFADPPAVAARVQASLRAALGTAHAEAETRGFLEHGPSIAPAVFASHCEVASRLAARLGMPPHVIGTVNALHERWDGRGLDGLAATDIPLAARILKLAEVGTVYGRVLARDELRALIERRAGSDLDPELVRGFDPDGLDALSAFGDESVWDQVLACEPTPRRRVAEAKVIELARVLADYSDLKSPYTLGHARGVAALAQSAAEAMALPADDILTLELAALLHDLGRASIPNGILDSPRTLNRVDRERAQRHAYESERILSLIPSLSGVARLAGQAHERLDGSGYHRGLQGSGLSTAARVLSAANAYRGLIEGRAYRPALTMPGASERLRSLVTAGVLDREAVEAVLHAAGDRSARRIRSLPAGLTPREVEVLRLLARGLTNPQIGEALTISPRTAQQHVRHIYAKIGATTRAGATLFVAEHDLLGMRAGLPIVPH
ncbi:MAG: HD domain-containing phosphohydrolase [Dehalococcoidia bacterium]